MTAKRFLNIRYVGERFSGGHIPLDVLRGLKELDDIFSDFVREILRKKNGFLHASKKSVSWFNLSLTGVEDGSAIPKIEITINEKEDLFGHVEDSRIELIAQAQEKFADVLMAANDNRDIELKDSTRMRFWRIFENLRQGDSFSYSPDPNDKKVNGANVIFLDGGKCKIYFSAREESREQRIRGHARMIGVTEKGELNLFNLEFGNFRVCDKSEDPRCYGGTIGQYYDFDLTAISGKNNKIKSVKKIHNLSLKKDLDEFEKHPLISQIDKIGYLKDGWLHGYGHPVSEEIRNSAKNFLDSLENCPEFYAVAPTEEGGILLEYAINGWDYGIEFHADKSFAVFGNEVSGTGEFSDDFPAENRNHFIERAKETLS